MSYRFAAYTLPNIALNPFTPLVDQLPVQDWSFEDQRQRARATIDLAIPSAQTTILDRIFFVDPDNHAIDIGSVVNVYREGIEDLAGNPAPVLTFLMERRPDGMEDKATELTELQGTHILSLFDYATLRAWDYPTLPSVEIDWMYDADSILTNGDFDSGALGNEIQSIWIDDTVDGGTFDVRFGRDTASGLAWDITQANLQTALQSAFTTVISLSITGSGTEESPWLVEFQDPGGADEFQMAGTDNLANGTLHIDTVQNGGMPSFSPWIPSTLLTTGEVHGAHASDSPRLDDFVAHSGTFSLRINGLEQFAGIQQTVQVIPGMRYQASIWLYVENAVDKFRLVIRDRFEALVAHSTPFEDTGTVGAWKEFTTSFIAPSWTDILIFRFAYVGSGNPLPFWVDDAKLSPGGAAATIGSIWLEMLADIQVDHAADPRGALLAFVVPTFDAVNDSDGQSWPGLHKLTLNEGNTYLQIMEHHQENYGYEFDLRYDQDDDTFYFDIFQPGGLGTSHPAINPAIVVGGGVTGGEAVRSAPSGNSVFVRGSGGLFYESKGVTVDTWGLREMHVAAKDAHSARDLLQIGLVEIDKAEDAMIGLQFKVADNAQSVPILHYRAGDYLTVTPGSDTAINSGSRRIETIKVSGHGGQVSDIDVHVQSEVYGSLGLAAQAEAVRRLLRMMRFTEPETGGPVTLALGGGGIPDVVIGASDTEFLDTANIIGDGTDDDLDLAEAVARLEGQDRGWIHFLAGNYNFDAGVFISGPNELKITGAGMGVTIIHLTSSFADEAAWWHGGTVDTPNTINLMTVEDLSIDGNKAGGTTVLRGLLASSLGSAIPYYLTRVELYDSPTTGLGSDVASVARSANIWHITNCHIHDNNGSGLGIMGSSSHISTSRILNNGGAGINTDFGGMHIVVGTEIAFNGGHGMDGESLTGRAAWIVTGSNIHDNGGGGLINGGLSDPIVVVGNYITNNAGQSIFGVVGSITSPNYIAGNGTDEPTPISSRIQQVVTFTALEEAPGLFVATGQIRFVVPWSGVIAGVQAALGESPTGADFITDMHKNGVTIFTTQANRPTITDGGSTSAVEIPDVVAVAAGDSFTIDIDQVGSTTPGNFLTVMVQFMWDKAA